ncbi:hypothetical protein HU200_003196 [Digitaria exilis]|uniref:Uncharacterized protein n=1 Tax=Digitaria exilis TaxID=1010633 RepID=A0A835FXU5_9POAL|nr:hypothetical protein HU200_003196 [Digitaria exilis]
MYVSRCPRSRNGERRGLRFIPSRVEVLDGSVDAIAGSLREIYSQAATFGKDVAVALRRRSRRPSGRHRLWPGTAVDVVVELLAARALALSIGLGFECRWGEYSVQPHDLHTWELGGDRGITNLLALQPNG